MGRFDAMRASSRFNSRPFGMPEMDDSSLRGIMNDIEPLVNSMKNDDMFRQRQMMEFENSLRQSNRPPVQIAPPQKKNFVVNYGQAAKLPPSPVEANNAAREANVAQLNKEFAAINEQRGEKQAARDSIEKISGQKLAAETLENTTQREFTAGENKKNREQKGQPYMMPDPNDPSKQIAVRWNPATETVEPIKYNDQTISNLTKPGTKPTGPTPALRDLRGKAQEALDEIKNVLGDDDKLTSKGQSAFGKSAAFRWIPGSEEKSGTGSVRRIQSQQILNVIEDMKAQSRTGATGFGAMNKDELRVLESAASKLSDPYISEEDGRRELKRIKEKLNLILKDEEAAPDSNKGSVDIGKRPRLDPDELLRKYGG